MLFRILSLAVNDASFESRIRQSVVTIRYSKKSRFNNCFFFSDVIYIARKGGPLTQNKLPKVQLFLVIARRNIGKFFLPKDGLN